MKKQIQPPWRGLSEALLLNYVEIDIDLSRIGY
jgi:hypothetical protein